MKKLIVNLIVLFSISMQAQDITPYVDAIKKENVKKHVYTLAAPEMMGRDTGEEGQKDAAEYISNVFREIQLDSLNYAHYQQPFDLFQLDKGKVNLSYYKYLSEKDTTIERHFTTPWIATGNIEFDGKMPTYYVGYGEQAIDKDLSDHIVLLLSNGSMTSTHDAIERLKVNNKAKVFIVASDVARIMGTKPTKDDLITAKNNKSYIQGLYLSSGKVSSDNFKAKEETVDDIIELLPEDVLINYMSKWLFEGIMGSKIKDLYKAEKNRIKDKEYTSYTPKTDSIYCDIEAHLPVKETIDTENVLAYIEGTDLKDEVIVITGHYDHIGAENDTTINYGADDNASGTTGVMEIAAALQRATNDGIRPRRSIIFVAFSGEEIGLRGSQHFVNNCPVDINSVALNINMDMIGRNCGDKADSSRTVYLINKGKKDGYVKRVVKKTAKPNDDLIVSTHPGLVERLTWSMSSDHFRFSRKGIPITCFFTGLHPDYHTPRDTPDKINYDKLTEICKMCTQSVWTLANTDKKILTKHKQKKKGFIEKMMD